MTTSPALYCSEAIFQSSKSHLDKQLCSAIYFLSTDSVINPVNYTKTKQRYMKNNPPAKSFLSNTFFTFYSRANRQTFLRRIVSWCIYLHVSWPVSLLPENNPLHNNICTDSIGNYPFQKTLLFISHVISLLRYLPTLEGKTVAISLFQT